MASLEIVSSSTRRFSSTTSVPVAVQEGLLKRIEIVGQESHYECVVCSRSMAGTTPAQAHLQGAPHMKALKRFNQAKEDEESMRDNNGMFSDSQDTSRILYQGVIGDVSTKAGNMEHHSKDTTDSFTSAEMQGLVTATTVGHVTLLMCNVCKISCNSEVTMNQHLQGESHLKKIRRTGDGGIQSATASRMVSQNIIAPPETSSAPAPTSCNREEGLSKDAVEVAIKEGTVREAEDGDPSHLLCVVCSTICTGEEPMSQHLMGKTHLKKQQWMQQRENSPVPVSASGIPQLHQDSMESSVVTQDEVKQVKYSPPPRRSTSDSPPQSKRSTSDSPLESAMELGILLESEFGYECLICFSFFNGVEAVTKHLQDQAHKQQFQEHIAAESSFMGTNGRDEKPSSISPDALTSECAPPILMTADPLGTGRPNMRSTPTPLRQLSPRGNCGLASVRQDSDTKVYNPSDAIDDLFD